MHTEVYIAGKAPSAEIQVPGAYGLLIYQGKLLIQERSRRLGQTTELNAWLTGALAATEYCPIGSSVTLYTQQAAAAKLLNGSPPRTSATTQLLHDLSSALHHRQLKTDIVHVSAHFATQMAKAVQAAEQAARQAWKIANAPACPKCGRQMEVQHFRGHRCWRCTGDLCHHELPLYSPL